VRHTIVTERDLITFAPIFILVGMPEADPIALYYIARALECEQRANHATISDVADGWREIGKSYQRLAVVATRAPIVSDIHPYRARPERHTRRKTAWVRTESAAALSHLSLVHPKPRY
jgi:hypothetical protein